MRKITEGKEKKNNWKCKRKERKEGRRANIITM